jgi:hypothetical protein
MSPSKNSQFLGDQFFFSCKLSYPLKLSKFVGILPFFFRSISFFMPQLCPLHQIVKFLGIFMPIMYSSKLSISWD